MTAKVWVPEDVKLHKRCAAVHLHVLIFGQFLAGNEDRNPPRAMAFLCICFFQRGDPQVTMVVSILKWSSMACMMQDDSGKLHLVGYKP
jgi:hypothetical protein